MDILSNGWVRVWLSINSGNNNLLVHRVYERDRGSSNVTGEYSYAWGAQAEVGGVETAYIPVSDPQIDTIAVPFDSRVFLGGRPTMATFTTDNRLAFFSGDNLAATIDTADIEPDPVSRTFVNGVRVITDAPAFTIQDGVSDFHGGAITFSTASSPNRAGLCPMRSDGRLHKFRLSVPSATEWSIASSVDVNSAASGQQ
jgi:hypothetical protein